MRFKHRQFYAWDKATAMQEYGCRKGCCGRPGDAVAAEAQDSQDAQTMTTMDCSKQTPKELDDMSQASRCSDDVSPPPNASYCGVASLSSERVGPPMSGDCCQAGLEKPACCAGTAIGIEGDGTSAKGGECCASKADDGATASTEVVSDDCCKAKETSTVDEECCNSKAVSNIQACAQVIGDDCCKDDKPNCCDGG